MTNERSSKDLRALLKSVGDSGWDYAHIELDGLTIIVSSDPESTIGVGELVSTAQARPSGAMPVETQLPPGDVIPEFSRTEAVASPADEPEQGNIAIVASPSIGLFWRSPKPGAPPFVEVGQYVTEEETVCIVEVMKLMTHVKAGHAGTVARIRPQNGEMVEFGTPIMDISLS